MVSPRHAPRRSPRHSKSPSKRHVHKSSKSSREHKSSKEGRRDRSRSKSHRAADKESNQAKSVSPVEKGLKAQPQGEEDVELQMSPVTPRDSDAEQAFAVPAGMLPLGLEIF